MYSTVGAVLAQGLAHRNIARLVITGTTTGTALVHAPATETTTGDHETRATGAHAPETATAETDEGNAVRHLALSEDR
jgi:hypothetical protein